MGVDQARAVLARHTAFTRDHGDELWAALLSLADADELVAQATRLDWQFHPRGFNNTDLHERYGDGIVPWLATRLDDRGVLHNLPWCVAPCLLACGSDAAFDLAWRVRSVEGRTPWGGAGDRDFASTWLARHPDVGRAGLRRVAAMDALARAHLFVLDGPTPGRASAADVLALLDACARGLYATRVRLTPPSAHHAVRAIAARSGDDWGIACEWIDGTRTTGLLAARVAGIAYGSRVRGPVAGAAPFSRTAADLSAADLDARLGPPVLASLGLAPDAVVVASVPHVAFAPVPSESPVYQALAAAITGI